MKMNHGQLILAAGLALLAVSAGADDLTTAVGGGVGAAAGAALGSSVGGKTGAIVGGAAGGAVGGAVTTEGKGKTGAAIGGAVGGGTGAAVGHSLGGTTGAVVGAGVGGAAGATIGKNVGSGNSGYDGPAKAAGSAALASDGKVVYRDGSHHHDDQECRAKYKEKKEHRWKDEHPGKGHGTYKVKCKD